MPIKHAIMAVWIGVLALAACSPQNTPLDSAETATKAATASATLRPYRLASNTPRASNTPPGTATPSPSATFTPVTYVVKGEDDMFGIALRFGVSLEALKTANPTVIPRAMSVGTILTIPITPQPNSGPTPTPVTPTPTVLDVRLPVCYRDAGSGLWCFILVRNASQRAFENVQGMISLISEGQEPLRQPAYALLNLLPVGEMIPLAAYFVEEPSQPYSIGGEITLSLPQPEDDTRYLPVQITSQQSVISDDGLSAEVTGTLSLFQGSASASSVWLALTAFSTDGQVVGIRKWEADAPLLPGKERAFSVTVYSLGPAIATLTLQSEARP